MRTAMLSVLAIGLGIAGCGGNDDKTATAQPAASGSTVRVTETEFKIAPANLNVKKSGAITFHVTNGGKLPHSLEVEGNGVEKRIQGSIAPGSSATLKVDLKPGKYEWYCPVDGHKAMGMKGEITVAGGSGGGGSSAGKGKGKSGGGY